MKSQIAVSHRRHLLAAIALSPLTGWAQQKSGWPDRPVRFIVGWPPGGSADSTARLLAERLTRRIGQPIVVENRPGASGRLGVQLVINSEPDGYTILFGAPSEITIAAATVQVLPYDFARDLQPITTVVSGAMMMVADARFAPNNVPELVSYAKANPNKLNYASYGNNTTNHIYGAQFCSAANIEATHVPYKGGAPAWNDMMAGQVQFMFDNAAVVMPLVRSGKLKALAVLGTERIALTPGTPTMAESGYPNIGFKPWLGLFAPARVPVSVVSKLHDEVAAVLSNPEFTRQLEERGTPPWRTTPAEFGNVLRNETAELKTLVRKLGLKLE
ncbi:Bug family tripartite tricarboxylate transporter substrate binding protein [Variovorax terrae]|uniref:Tripartite tricarboxylate transporter substrate binding protein n=1 Tax=Variovorax terrae TaxID=2923278 RepID=A0A9X2AM86_9BURK|nr:tripartite tricarboxylate transporter substrate binding protein [Variovorax terrae]MCJ0763458.1 tripartite tricarboxylate transporter substrate binding protein [Variovorax terrae]